jgi:hypothetical protein
MQTQAQTLHTFLTNNALSGNFTDLADLQQHYKQNYNTWLHTNMLAYYAYLQNNFPTLTLAQVSKLLANDA